MAENNQKTTLDIVIRMLADGQGAQVTKQQLAEIKKEAAGLEQKQQRSPGEEARLQNAKQVTEALKQQKAASTEVSKAAAAEAEENVRRRRLMEELRASQAAGTQEEEKASRGKERLKEVNQGLAASMGGVGTQLRALLSPLGAVVAVIGGAVVVVRNLIAEYDAMAASTANFGRQQERLRSMRELNIEAAASVRELATAYRQVRDEMQGVSTEFGILTSAMLAQQRANEEIEDEQLKTRLAEIQAMDIGQHDKNVLTARAQADARSRKDERRAQGLLDKGSLLSREEMAQEQARQAAEAGAAALVPRLTGQKQQQDIAAKDAEDVSKRATEAIAKLRDEISVLRPFAEGKIDPAAVAKGYGMALGASEATVPDPKTLALEATFGPSITAEKGMQEREALIAQHQQDIERANAVQAQEAARLAELEGERRRLLERALAAEKERSRISVELEKLGIDYDILRSTQPVLQGERAKQDAFTIEAEREKAAEEQRKKVESAAEAHSRRALEMQEKGFGEPERPEILNGYSWSFDKGSGRVKNLRKAVDGASQDISEMADIFLEFKKTTAEAVSRMRNDGGRVR
jgi:hypothetical protein